MHAQGCRSPQPAGLQASPRSARTEDASSRGSAGGGGEGGMSWEEKKATGDCLAGV